MLEGLGDALNALFKLVAVVLLITVPLAIWKLVELIIFLFTKVEVSIK